MSSPWGGTITVMDYYFSSQFSHINYVFHLILILFSYIPWLSILTQQNFPHPSLMFFCLLSRSLPEYISPHTCTYPTLLICAIYGLYLPSLESLVPRPNLPLPLVLLVASELTKLLITSISLRPTLKGSFLVYLDHSWCLRNNSKGMN